MKDKAYLLCITLISFLPLCGMNDGKKRKMPVQNLKQSSMKKQKAEQKQITIYHDVSNVMLKYLSYDKRYNNVTETATVLTGYNNIVLNPSPDHPTVMHFTLPTAPQEVRLSVESKDVKYGDSLYIHDEGKTVVIKNSTTNKELLRLPKQNSFFHVGQRKKGPQPSKIITIHNDNALLVTVNHATQQEPLRLSNDPNVPSIKESKLFLLQACTLRAQQSFQITTKSSITCPRVINSFITLTIHGALQRIKIFSIDDNIQDGDMLSVKYCSEDALFHITNQNGQCLTCCCTINNYTEIK